MGAIAPPPNNTAKKLLLNVTENISSDSKLSLIPLVSADCYVE